MNRSLLVLFPFLLAACPFILGPPAVPTGTEVDADVDTDADADTDADTDSGTLPTTGTTSPTGGTPTGTTTTPDPPEIANITTTFGYGVARVVVEIDATTPLEGGVIEVDDGNLPIALSIPVDLAAWDPAGIATLEFPTGTPCGGLNLAWSMSVTDNSGSEGPVAIASLDVAGYDHVEGNDPVYLGNITAPAIICGELSPGSELDWIQFTGVGGTWRLSLHDLDVPFRDRDILLQDAAGIVTLAAATTPYDPDTLVYAFTSVLDYQIEIDNPGGGGGSEWQVIFHHF